MSSRLRTRVVYYFYRAAGGALGLAPYRLARALGTFAGAVAWACSPRRRAVIADNISHILGRDAASKEVQALLRPAFCSYGRYWTEVASLHDPSQLDSFNFTRVNGEHLDAAMVSNRGAVVALPHLGAWEVGGAFVIREGHGFTTVAEATDPPELFTWFQLRREQLGMRVLPLRGSTARELMEVVRAGGMVALVCDRDVVGDGMLMEFFGETTRVPAGPAMIALRTGAMLLTCAVIEVGVGRFEIRVNPPIDVARRATLREDVQRVTTTIVGEFEELIRRAPEQWHVFQPNWPTAAADSDVADTIAAK